jgi:hypothetical protein
VESVKKPRYRALVGVQFADGKTETGDPKEHRVEAGLLIPARFDVPVEWVGRKVEEA